MPQIQYSKELLKDFSSLLKDFVVFMSFNLMHADKGIRDQTCREKMIELIKYSTRNCAPINGFFKEPLLANETENKEKLLRNFDNLIQALYTYLQYAEPILKSCKPDIYSGRFEKLKKHYREFVASHLGRS